MTMFKFGCLVRGSVCGGRSPGRESVKNQVVPNFVRHRQDWLGARPLGRRGQFAPAVTGEPGPVPFERAHLPKAAYRPYRVADLSNSILQADHSTDEEGV